MSCLFTSFSGKGSGVFQILGYSLESVVSDEFSIQDFQILPLKIKGLSSSVVIDATAMSSVAVYKSSLRMK